VAGDRVNRLARTIVAGAAICLFPSLAEAHLMNTGFGPFYDGLAHPLVTPEDLLAVVAIALLAGLRGARSGRFVVFVLPAAWLLGIAAGRAFAPHDTSLWLTSLLTIVFGALVAADRDLPLPVVAGSAMLLGVVHGWLNGAGLAPATSGITEVLGVGCTIFVVTTLLSGTVVSLRKPWLRLVIRVAGSWIAAMGLLMLGWSFRKGHP
jgi:hydrogenase/urease accessory protein HupE